MFIEADITWYGIMRKTVNWLEIRYDINVLVKSCLVEDVLFYEILYSEN